MVRERNGRERIAVTHIVALTAHALQTRDTLTVYRKEAALRVDKEKVHKPRLFPLQRVAACVGSGESA